jgi:transcription elongation factor Elf1
MLEQIKVYAIDVDKMDDNFNCLTCNDEDFITESIRQEIKPIDIRRFERMLNINVFNNDTLIIRFILN